MRNKTPKHVAAQIPRATEAKETSTSPPGKSQSVTKPSGANAESRWQSNGRASQSVRPLARRSRTKWPWAVINFWLDSVLLVVFLSLVWVSVVIRFVFPPASTAQEWLLWGYNVDQWMGLQFFLTAMLGLGILIHLMLHWSWVCGVFFSRIWRRNQRVVLPDDGTRTIYGVGLMIVLLNVLGLLLAAAALGIKSPL